MAIILIGAATTEQTPRLATVTPIPTPQETETPPATPETIEEPPTLTARIYDIPLDAELQEYTFWRCEELDLDYEMVLALMAKESSYRITIVSSTNDYGLMQITDPSKDL